MYAGKVLAFVAALVLCGCLEAASTGEGEDGTSVFRRAEEGCPPLETFSKAICVCEDFNDVGKVNVGPYRLGPYGMNYPYEDEGGSVGVNGTSSHTALVGASGSWDAWVALHTTGDFIIGQSVTTTGDLTFQGALRVHGDLSVGGNLSGTGQVIVEGALRLAGETDRRGMMQVGSEAPYVAPAAPPCPCDPATFFDVVAAVESARAANDNALQGVPTDLALEPRTEITLPTGRYFFENLESQGKVVINIAGTVAIYIAGSLDSVGYENFRLADEAQLDLFVSGNIRTVGHMDMAQEYWHGAGHGWPYSRFRLYLGGSDPFIVVTGNQFWGGSIYAPTAAAKFNGHLMVNGSLFVRTFLGAGHLEVYGGLQIPPDSCPEPIKVDCYGDPDNPICVQN